MPSTGEAEGAPACPEVLRVMVTAKVKTRVRVGAMSVRVRVRIGVRVRVSVGFSVRVSVRVRVTDLLESGPGVLLLDREVAGGACVRVRVRVGAKVRARLRWARIRHSERDKEGMFEEWVPQICIMLAQFYKSLITIGLFKLSTSPNFKMPAFG